MGNSVLKSPYQGFTFNLLQSFHQLYTRYKIFATTRKIAGNPTSLRYRKFSWGLSFDIQGTSRGVIFGQLSVKKKRLNMKKDNMSELHFMKMSTPIWNFRQLKTMF